MQSIESISDLCPDATFLFIAGAPRSGTTLLGDLLDGHPELLRFPTEHKTLEQYFWNEHQIESYARDKFISDRKQGQQTLLANESFSDVKRKAIQKEYGKDFSIVIDHSQFLKSYKNYLSSRPANLENMLNGLVAAQISACEYSRQRAGAGTKYFVFKQPFFTELFAQEVASKLPRSRFVHILRNPVSRYASAKSRRLKQHKLRKKRLGPINRMAYVTGHTYIDLASRHLARENLSKLGDSTYRHVSFEELAQSPDQTIDSILQWLGLTSLDAAVLPTRNGINVDSGSSLSSGFKVDAASTRRSNVYHSITSPEERLIHASLLGRSENRTTSIWRIIPAFLRPLPNSNWKNYVCQITDLSKSSIAGSQSSVTEFVKKAKRGECSINGGT